MSETHEIIGPARGLPLAEGRSGASVRVPLDSPPTPRWSSAFGARLSSELVGHPAVGDLRLDRVVQGAELVLDGVELREASLLGPALRTAIDAANRTCANDQPAETSNMAQADADIVAHTVSTSHQQGGGARP